MKKVISAFTIITMLILCGCASLNPMKAFDSNSNGWKPHDFVPSKGTLLIERAVIKNQQKKIEDFMAKEYSYKYEFVDAKDLSANIAKYNDKDLYRFALVSSYSTHNVHQSDMSRRALNVTAFDYNFVDRLHDKDYPSSGIASSWASMTLKKIIEACLKN